MDRQYIAIALFLLYIVVGRFFLKKRLTDKGRGSLTTRYVYGMLARLGILCAFFIIDPDAFRKIDFQNISNDFSFDKTFVVTILLILTVHIVSAAKNPGRYTKGKTEDEVYGILAKVMPNTYNELAVFSLTIFAAVVFEELLFRQFLFSSFYSAFHLEGNWLLVVSSAIFTVAHHYKKARQILGIFLSGLILGESFLVSGNLVYPILVHLFMNAPLIVLAIHRIKKMYI